MQSLNILAEIITSKNRKKQTKTIIKAKDTTKIPDSNFLLTNFLFDFQ